MSGSIGDNPYRASGVIAAAAAGGGVSWQSVETGTTFTAEAGNGYPVNTTSNACTVTLPASASVGDEIIFTDYARKWATNALTINQNSLNFQGNSAVNPVYDTNGESVHIVYMDATQGWVPTYDGAVALEAFTFTGTVDYLVIAGGGGGGAGNSTSSYGGGGGGAGGYRASYNSEASGGGGGSETTETQSSGTTYTITVGAGGVGCPFATLNPDDAEDSSFIGDSDAISITSAGGGGGSARNLHDSGYLGGSGGGASASGTIGAGTPNQGYAGGPAAGYGNGGGGGAGAVGVVGDESAQTGGAGGVGVASTIDTNTTTRAGGGGGAGASGSGGSGGTGGGAAGGKLDVQGGDGTVNTGGGGGASSSGIDAADLPGGVGGKGVVIVRMKDDDYSSSTGSPTVATGQGGSSDETILTFTGDGTYTTS